MILCDLSEVIDSNFSHQIMCHTFLTTVDEILMMYNLQGKRNGRMLPITDIGHVLSKVTVTSVSAIVKQGLPLIASFLMIISVNVFWMMYHICFIIKSNGIDS